ncbi:MAG: winged helix-turn-helix domain-containing protein [Solirubrobacteraceae bacterium]
MTSTMIEVKIDRSDPTLLHDQVAAQIRRSISEGDARPGERLPPARDLAAVMNVNTNTVLRALRLLRDEGLLEFRQGRGIRVSGTPQRGVVLAKAIELVQLGRQSGYNRAELLAIIEALP